MPTAAILNSSADSVMSNLKPNNVSSDDDIGFWPFCAQKWQEISLKSQRGMQDKFSKFLNPSDRMFICPTKMVLSCNEHFERKKNWKKLKNKISVTQQWIRRKTIYRIATSGSGYFIGESCGNQFKLESAKSQLPKMASVFRLLVHDAISAIKWRHFAVFTQYTRQNLLLFLS